MEEKKELKQIDFAKIAKAMWTNKKIYIISLPLAFIIACGIIFSVPRYYSCTVKLAPELDNMSSNSISSIASIFGVDLGNRNTGVDAIFPELYPDLISSVDFKTSMFFVKVESLDGKIKTTYADYLMKNQKTPWWDKIKNILSAEEQSKENNTNINPFKLTNTQSNIANTIGSKIACNIDKKNYVISITVTDQDPLIAATIADSAKAKLQDFITRYRTKKAQKELDYTHKLYVEAKRNYERSRQLYGSFADANMDVILQSAKSKQDDIENDMQLKYNIYTQLTSQLQSARAKLIEQTPAFTTLQSATVPVKPAGPQRMIFTIACVILTFFIDTLVIIKRNYSTIFG